MCQPSYTQYIKEHPGTPFSNFLIRFFSAKPDFTQLNKEVEEFQAELYKEQMAELEQRLAEKHAKEEAEGDAE